MDNPIQYSQQLDRVSVELHRVVFCGSAQLKVLSASSALFGGEESGVSVSVFSFELTV